MTNYKLYSIVSVTLSVSAIFAARQVASSPDAYIVLGICGLSFFCLLVAVWSCDTQRIDPLVVLALLSLLLAAWYWTEQVKANPISRRAVFAARPLSSR